MAISKIAQDHMERAKRFATPYARGIRHALAGLEAQSADPEYLDGHSDGITLSASAAGAAVAI